MPFFRRRAARPALRWLLPAALLVCLAGAGAQPAAEYNKLGIEAFEAGRYGDAVGYFEKALDKARGNGTVRRNLCNARQGRAQELAAAEDFRGAIQEAERAADVDPDNPSPLVQLGSYYLHEGLVRDAIARLEQAIEIKPGHLDAHELLGRAYYAENDLASARTQWEYVLQVEPGRAALRTLYEKALREESVEFDFEQGTSRHFRLKHPDDLSYRRRSTLLTLLERIYMEVCRELRGAYPPGPIEVTVYGGDDFARATLLDEHVGAVYDGKIRAPLTDSEGAPLDDAELRRRLTHEFVHVVVDYLVKDRAPWWLNEGLAETLSKSTADIDAALLRRASDEGRLFDLARLEGAQLNRLDPDALRLAYAQSHATVDYLWRQYGAHRVRQFLTELPATGAPEEVLVRLLRLDYDRLTRQALARLD